MENKPKKLQKDNKKSNLNNWKLFFKTFKYEK